MSVPAEKLTTAYTAVQINLQEQIVMLRKINDISESQLESANLVIEEMKGMSSIQNELIDSLTAMNDRYEVLLKQRDDFIEGLKF